MKTELIEGRACKPKRNGTTWQCSNWQTLDGEWYCGHCALPLPPVAIELDPPEGEPTTEDGAASAVALAFDRDDQPGWLPPGAMGGDHREGGRAAENGAAREVALVFDRCHQLRHEELTQFVIEVKSSDRREHDWEIPLDKFRQWGRATLQLATRPGSGPLDLTVGLRHKDHGPAEPIAIGHFGYPAPSVEIPRSPVILLHPASDALRVAVSIAPESAHVTSCRLDIPELAMTLAGAVTDGDDGLTVEFPIDARACNALEALDQSAPATLAMAFKGVASETALDLTLARVAALEWHAQAELRALTGRRARIGAQLKNSGGSAAIVGRIGWQLFDAARQCVARGEIEDHAGRRIGRDGYGLELRPCLVDEAGAPLPRGPYGLELEIHYRDENAAPGDGLIAHGSLRLDVRPDAPYRGLVCIDFGTTDTAAAILAPGRTYFEDTKTGQTPRPIELGRTAPFDPADGRYFIPTQVAVGLDALGTATMLFAEDATEGPAWLHSGRIVDRLKWQLGKGLDADDPDEFNSIEELVAGYLDHVRRLIEEHPEVAARVEKVIATRPARFGEMRERALISAFRRAGMEVDLTRFGDHARPMVSESWPPVLLMLPIREGPGKQVSTRLLAQLKAVEPRVTFPEPLELSALADRPHHLCIFDVGGGSTDVSLLRLSIEGARIHVSDQWTHTDDHFAGEGIRDLIVAELRVSARLAVAGSGKPFSEDLRCLREIAAELQFYPNGPFNRVSSSFFDFADKYQGLAPADTATLSKWLEDGVSMVAAARNKGSETEAGALLAWLQQEFEHYVQPSFGYEQRLSLPLGSRRTLELSGDALHDLMIRMFLRFYREFQPHVEAIYVELQHRLKDADSDDVRMLMTGRGSAFALNDPLIRHVSAALKVHSEGFHRAPGGSAKAVTSWGALALYASRRTAKMLEFTGLSGGYALCATNILTREREGIVALDPVHVEGRQLYGLPFHRIPQGFDPAILTIGEDLGPRQEADVYARLSEFDIEIGQDRRNRPAGGLLFDPQNGRVISVADFSKPLIE